MILFLARLGFGLQCGRFLWSRACCLPVAFRDPRFSLLLLQNSFYGEEANGLPRSLRFVNGSSFQRHGNWSGLVYARIEKLSFHENANRNKAGLAVFR
jgi:hypothetical protein